MSTASDKTFYSILSDGELKSTSDKVLNTVRKLRRCTKVEIMKANGMSHQTVTARLSELMDSGLIKVANTRKGSRSFLSIFSPETNKEQVAVNASIRERARFEKWLKKGEEFKHLINEQGNLGKVQNENDFIADVSRSGYVCHIGKELVFIMAENISQAMDKMEEIAGNSILGYSMEIHSSIRVINCG